MKISWHSVAPWVGSGYGQQTATFTPRIAALGHDIAISAYYGLQGSKLAWNGIPVYPAYEKAYGADVIVTHALDHFDVEGLTFPEAAASGVIITLTDVWVLGAPLLPDMSVASWCPVDHVQLPGITRRWFEKVGAVPIAMSRFGEKLLAEAELNPLYVPHGIDLSVFRPGDKTEARERVGLPEDAFVVAMVAANVGRDGNRKAFAEQISAFAELRRRHNDALLVLHTNVDNIAGSNLKLFLEHLPDDAYIYTDQYAITHDIPAEVIADIYRSADILTNVSWGEGFGIPIVEAQACGTPVVVTDATAMPELCGAGWKVGFEPIWHESQEAWAAMPRIGEIVAAYEEAYDHAADMRDDAVAFAAMYDADLITDMYWVPVLKKLEEGLERRMEDARKPQAPKPKIIEADGFLWVDRGKATEDYLGPSAHEAELEPILTKLIDPDSVVLEVGAHVGHWTVRLAEKTAAWLAVEANPDAASVLRRNLAINDIGNVEVLELAAWDSDTTLRLEDPNGHVAGGSTRTLPTNGDGSHKKSRDDSQGPALISGIEGDAGITVAARRLDESIETERLDLVKLDVEGADLHVLRGLSGLLAKHQPTLFIECHDYAGYYTRAELTDTLAHLGYVGEVVHTYQSTWSPEGTLDEPVDADYMIATPAQTTPDFAAIAQSAVRDHGASQHADELAEALTAIQRQHLQFGYRAPNVIVEIGCDVGGTLYAWQTAFPDADVCGVTLNDNSFATGGSDGELVTHRATIIEGDSHDEFTRERLVVLLADRPIDVLVLDGDHTIDGIWNDLRDYGPLVRAGGLILLHDIASKGDDRAHVWEVWPELVDRFKTSEIRSKVHPYGWGIIHVREADFVRKDVMMP